jgi:hypothetical protein
LGTPAAGGIVLAINYWKWGRKGLAVAAVTVALLATAVLGWLAWIAPMWVPAVAFLAPQVLAGYFLARWLQGKRFDAHIAGGGKQASNWVGAGIGLAICAPLIAAFAAFIVFSDVSPARYSTSRNLSTWARARKCSIPAVPRAMTPSVSARP